MLTPEQLDAIIASRVALIQPYYTNGELKRYEAGKKQQQKRWPWPEFWPGYNEAVKERDELAVHIEFGVFPEHLFRERAPNQTEEEFEYIRANFKQVTLPSYVDYENTFRRGVHNIRLSFGETEQAMDFETYTENRIGELGDFVKWEQGLLPKIKTLDPMGIICTMPTNVPVVEGLNDEGEPVLVIDDSQMVEPQPNYFPVQNVWGYEHGIWYALLRDERSEVMFGGTRKRMGFVFWVVDDTFCYRVAQSGNAVDLTFTTTVHFQHDTGYPPCIFLMGTPVWKQGKLVWQSNYIPAKPAFDTVLLDSTYLMSSKSNAGYPMRIMAGNHCEYIDADMYRCMRGILMGVSEDGKTPISKGKCPNCVNGVTANLSPHGVMYTKEQERGATGSPLSVHDAMTFVQPDPSVMQFMQTQIDANLNEGRRVMHLSSEQPMQGGDVKTATQAGIDVKAQMAFIRPVVDQMFEILNFTLDAMARQRYGPNVEAVYTLVPATTFDLRTEADYLKEFTDSTELPPSLRQGALEGYYRTRYQGSDMEQAYEAIFQADRLIAATPEEIAVMQAKGSLEPWELALHNEALSIYERLAVDKAFIDLDRFEKADRMKEAARERTVTPVAPAVSMTDKLLAIPGTTSMTQEKGKVVKLNAQAQTDTTVADTSLNGAQISSLVEIINQVSLGIITKETAFPLISAAFPGIQDSEISSMLAGVKAIAPQAKNAPTTDVAKAVPTV